MNDEQKSKPPGGGCKTDGRWMETWKIDVGGKKRLGEKRGEEGIYMLKLRGDAEGPSVLGKVVVVANRESTTLS